MNNQLSQILKQAILSFEGGNFSQAKALLSIILNSHSKNFDALHIMGIIYGSENNHHEALKFFKKAAKINPTSEFININLAKALSECGNDFDAIIHFQVVIKQSPKNANAWLGCGKSLLQLKRFNESLAHYDQAIQLKPDYAEAWSNKGATLNELKRFDEALAHYDQAIQLKPDYAETWSNKGVTLNELKCFDEALAHYDQAIQLKPDYAEAWSNKGATLNELKRFDEALAHYDQAIQLKPDYAEAWSNKGATLNELKRFDEALAHYDQAIQLKPDYAEAWSNKGATLNELKRFDEALAHYDQAIQLKPDYAEAWSNKGATLNELKRFDEALAHYDQAIELKPDYAEAWSNKGATLNELKRFDEALAHYDQAIELKPDYAEAWSNKGVTLKELKRFDEALAHYDQAIELKENIDYSFGDYLDLKMKICAWTDIDKDIDLCKKNINESRQVCQPLTLMALLDEPTLHKKCSEIYANYLLPHNSTLEKISTQPGNGKIRVGYFSADFRSHPVSYLTAELFELHDRKDFEITAFSFGPKDNSDLYERLVKSFDHFIDVSKKSDLEIAQISRQLNIDIAVDLTGYTANNRMRIFAHKAAPIQLSYIGFLGTIGSDCIDYLIADRIVIPENFEKFYSEKIIYLPSYQVNDRKKVTSTKVFQKQDLGIPLNAFVFCCFNNSYKITPKIFNSWMRILRAIDDSVLFLYADNKKVETNLRLIAENENISPKRLIFCERIPPEEYLARYQVCDLFLDTFPYNAGTTASDALWSGVPVITLMGQSFASRVASSVLNAVGLSGLITTTIEEYEYLAIKIAKDRELLKSIKQELIKDRLETNLFNTPAFTKHLENVFRTIHSNSLKNLLPDHLFF